MRVQILLPEMMDMSEGVKHEFACLRVTYGVPDQQHFSSIF
jgi:hypothetical protein